MHKTLSCHFINIGSVISESYRNLGSWKKQSAGRRKSMNENTDIIVAHEICASERAIVFES